VGERGKLIINLMIIVPAPWSSLRPFPFVIFTTNFLADCWIGHIKKSEEKSTQMGEVSNATSCPRSGREEFNETKNDHHIFGWNGKEKVDIDQTIGKKPAEGEKDSIDRSRGPNYRNELIWRKDNRANTSADSTE
jgi:hypothetical protein